MRLGELNVIADFGDFKVDFISKDDLLTNKRASGRPKDLVDFEKLRRDQTAKPMNPDSRDTGSSTGASKIPPFRAGEDQVS